MCINTRGMDLYLQSMPELRQKTLDVAAMGRLAEPGEIADAVVFLCSDRASFITDHDLVVDGGTLVRSNVIDLRQTQEVCTPQDPCFRVLARRLPAWRPKNVASPSEVPEL